MFSDVEPFSVETLSAVCKMDMGLDWKMLGFLNCSINSSRASGLFCMAVPSNCAAADWTSIGDADSGLIKLTKMFTRVGSFDMVSPHSWECANSVSAVMAERTSPLLEGVRWKSFAAFRR